MVFVEKNKEKNPKKLIIEEKNDYLCHVVIVLL
jgi:hypothetical protein